MIQCSLPCYLLFILCLATQPLRSQNFNANKELTLGIAAYDKSKYDEAITHLQRAVALDPKTIKAHLYLANAYNDSYVEADIDSEADALANDRWRILALQEYKEVLKLDPSNTKAMKSIAHRHFWSAEFDEAESYYRKTIAVDPNDAEALYTLAVIKWTHSFQLRQEKRSELKLSRQKPLIGLPACADIRVQNQARVEEGISLLMTSLHVLNSYDAMAYMGLLYRERADIQCGDPAAYDEDVKTSVQWAHRACEALRNPKKIMVPSRWPPAPPSPPPGEPGSCPD